ncbi:hypothetical protein Vretimale_12878 [Volvox reticuliferus]|uniref:Uncharacterized protein n=1 Tax=Volvox reticuliferus TaxID=1737510 RepID=A0A8J4FP10_9CHLO|nr:hypothetical protein Vretifemale_9246 [Volvox reticuliferus]GIM08998.1 hypothetical protein Vretimale_12878 [Volvox reticuliferus]
MSQLSKNIAPAKACFTTVRTLSTVLQAFESVSRYLWHDFPQKLLLYGASASDRCLAPSPTAVGWPKTGFYTKDSLPKNLMSGLPTSFVAIHRFPIDIVVRGRPSFSGWELPIQHPAQRSKHTRAGRSHAGPDFSSGAGRGTSGGAATEQQRPHRRLPRFKPSRKIMNTATLRELGELTAEEVAGWNTKELAAAARRAVSLWRREQPRAAARVQRMQRLLLLPPPNAMALPRVAAVNGGGSSTHSSSSSSAAGGGGSSYFNGWNEMRTAVKESGRGRFGDTAAPTTPLPCDPVELTQATPAAALSAERRSTAEAEAAVFPAAAPAAAAMPILAVQRSPLPRRRLTGGVYGTSVVVDRPLRPHELRLAQLVERLVQAGNGRLAEGFGSRELSTFVWSLVALGYWQPPLVPLVAAFADYGAERLRAADPIAMAIVLQVLAKARAAATAGQTTAAKLLELVPAAAAAAANSLPSCLPSCESRTLAGLLHSCTVLLSPRPNSGSSNSSSSSVQGAIGATGANAEPALTLAAESASRPESGSRRNESVVHLDGRTTEALAALAREVTKECVRRRFIGFGPVSLVTAAGALTALSRIPRPGPNRDAVLGGGDDGSTVWAMLASAAVSPTAPQMAGASPQQWTMLLRAARAQGGPSQQMLLAGAAAAGVSTEEPTKES